MLKNGYSIKTAVLGYCKRNATVQYGLPFARSSGIPLSSAPAPPTDAAVAAQREKEEKETGLRQAPVAASAGGGPRWRRIA